MRDLALTILKSHGGERDIVLRLQTLMNTPDNAMPLNEAMNRLRALRASCPPFAGRHSGIRISVAAAA